MKTRALLFGAGKNCVDYYEFLSHIYTIVGIVDNSPNKQGTRLFDLDIFPAAAIRDAEYDIIIVTPAEHDKIIEQLAVLGIEKSKILTLDKVIEDPLQALCGISIAVVFHGGIGDYLIGLNWLYHVVEKCKINTDEARIDAFAGEGSTGNAQTVFEPCSIVENLYSEDDLRQRELTMNKEYNLVIEFCIFPYVRWLWGEKLGVICPELLDYTIELQKFGLLHYCYNFCHSAHFYKTLRKLFEMFPDKNYYSLCDVYDNLGITEEFLCPFPTPDSAETYLQGLDLKKDSFIAVNPTMNLYLRQEKNSRSWPESHWTKLVTLIKEGFPKLKIVQIGTYATDRVELGADLNLSGETDLEQIKALLANALLLVDYEGGLVHMRHILHGGPSVVLFGPTSIEQHQYTENINIRADIGCPACEWTTPTWLNECPKGYDPPLCMERITPQAVYAKIENYIMDLSRKVQSENPQNVLRGQAALPRAARRKTAGGSPPRFDV